MSDLDIYSSPLATKPQNHSSHGYLRRTFDEYNLKISKKVYNKIEKVSNAEQKVLSTVKPVTKYIPINYETVKRVAVISLCTYSGLLQGRARRGYRRFLYPVFGFVVGNFACYPKQTSRITSKVMTTALPIVASAGKATAEGAFMIFQQTSSSFSSIYEKFSEQSVKETSGAESLGVVSQQFEVVSLDSAQLTTAVPEQFEVSEQSTEVVCEELLNEADTSQDEPSDDTVDTEEASHEMTCDTIIPLEMLPLPEEDVVPIEANLGMGDSEHEDMYSTRSSRS